MPFTFEGRPRTALEGQTFAGALHEDGVFTLSRSPKFHRPRGYTCGFAACGNCPLTVDGMPGVLACTTTVRGGEDVRREQGFPRTGLDLLRAADMVKPLLQAGFQFRLFAKSPRLSALAGAIMARLAGGGRMPTPSASASAAVTRVLHQAVDAMIVGGGPSGLAAGLGAADAGQRVVIVDRSFEGGRAIVRTEPIMENSMPVLNVRERYTRLLEEARGHPRVTLVEGTAIGFLDGVVPVVSGTSRWDIVPTRLIVATGSYEVPALFDNNDRPGIMLADAALKLTEVEGVRPGHKIVIATDSERGHDVAHRLKTAGGNVIAVIDARSPDAMPRRDWKVLYGMRPAKAHGWSRVRAVTVKGQSGSHRFSADTLVLAYGRRKSEELALHAVYADAGTHLWVTDDNPELPSRHLVVGTAAGLLSYDLSAVRHEVHSLMESTSPPDRPAPHQVRSPEGVSDAQE